MTRNVLRPLAAGGIGSYLVMLGLLSGCAGSPPWGGGASHPTPKQVEAAFRGASTAGSNNPSLSPDRAVDPPADTGKRE